jgi:2-hydroxychromene-2-carboxylate isomerase
LRRKVQGRKPTLHYFHQVNDPYSHLMVQVLPQFAQRFGLTLCPHVIDQIDPEMTPEPEMLRAYSLQDAQGLAELYDLTVPKVSGQHSDAVAPNAGAYLSQIAETDPDQFWTEAVTVGTAFWSNETVHLKDEARVGWSEQGEKMLAKLGHYLPATVFFEGEWYWGVDRLDHLEARLTGTGFGQGAITFNRTWKSAFDPVEAKSGTALPALEYYFSARSPYSYIGLFQARKFADSMGLELILHPVLPMMMRGMNVPFRKRFYILNDAKREAEKAGLPFGKIADPLGSGVERLYAVAYWVKQAHPDLLEEFFRVSLTGVVSEAIDVATDEGLRNVVERSGLAWEGAKTSLESSDWKVWVHSNRDQMASLGLWGVPTLRFGAVHAWGQDRFWRIRKEIQRLHEDG